MPSCQICFYKILYILISTLNNDYGPNCYIVLESAGIPMYLSGTCRTVREAVGQFKAGRLPTIYAPTSAGPA